PPATDLAKSTDRAGSKKRRAARFTRQPVAFLYKLAVRLPSLRVRRALLFHLLDQFNLNVDADLLAHQHAASLDGHIPDQAPILAVDGGGGAEACGDHGAERAGRLTVILDIQRHRLGNATDGQIAVQFARVLAGLLDPRALERDSRVIFNVQEVGRAQMRVAVGLACVDAGRVDLYIDRAIFRVFLVCIHSAAEALKLAAHVGDHHVTNPETNLRVSLINFPSHPDSS